ncbi:NEDD8-conjugating protein ubc12 [Coemansia sp. Benny D115]|nr:NEDD8-conjugating protein ubc12 [Coemansia sp. Benny D115]
MRRIWNQKKTEAEAQKLRPKGSPARIRLQKDLSMLDTESDTDIHFPTATDQTRFIMTYRPQQGFYEGGEFQFRFEISENFPHEAPKVVCTQTIYHPNIDVEGHVCLNILREDWKPVLNIQAVVFGLQMLFLEPNPDDPLNKEAAELMRTDESRFARLVRDTMHGQTRGDVVYQNVMASAKK